MVADARTPNDRMNPTSQGHRVAMAYRQPVVPPQLVRARPGRQLAGGIPLRMRAMITRQLLGVPTLALLQVLSTGLAAQDPPRPSLLVNDSAGDTHASQGWHLAGDDGPRYQLTADSSAYHSGRRSLRLSPEAQQDQTPGLLHGN